MRYRALVVIPGTEMPGKSKSEREKHHISLMHTQLRQWDSTIAVPPYYDPAYNADEVYSTILQRPSALPKNIDIDDPLVVMNLIGRQTGHVFYRNVPPEDKKLRDYRKREYEKVVAKFAKEGKEVPVELEERYRADLIEPKPCPKTGLYAYSVINPDGMFSSYTYPMKNVYNISLEASRLINRNYGTAHDVLLYGDLDFDATFLPSVVFCSGQMFESYLDDSDGGDPDEIMEWLEKDMNVTRKDYVAIIECEI